MKKIVILGSTGSIGKSALEVVRNYPKEFRVIGLSAKNNCQLLVRQAREFSVNHVGIGNSSHFASLKKSLPGRHIYAGEDSYTSLAALDGTDIVVSAIVGVEGLLPTWHALNNGRNVALANKESLVLAGDVIMALAKKKKAEITPVDSEHSAIWNLLRWVPRKRIERIILTASGGPFRNLQLKNFRRIRVEDALNHPTWSMGAKVTIDSATLLNKGFEVIEAHHLFGFPFDDIGVVIHPESIVHSFVKGRDGSFYGQFGPADMKFPILASLTADRFVPNNFRSIDLSKIGRLSFEEPDLKKFPLLKLSCDAGRAGGILPAVLAAADEVAVKKFLDRKIGFMDIHRMLSTAVGRYSGRNIARPGIGAILDIMKEVTCSLDR